MAKAWLDVSNWAIKMDDGEPVPISSLAIDFGDMKVELSSTAVGVPYVPPPPPQPQPQPEPEPEPQPTVARYLGRYSGNPYEDPDGDYLADYGNRPMITASYYTTQRMNKSYELARVQRGTSVLIDLDTKNHTPGFLKKIADKTSEGLAYVDQFWQDMADLVEAAPPGVIVMGALAHEWEVKVAQNVFTNADDRNPTVYAKAHDVFIERRDLYCPGAGVIYWTGAFSGHRTMMSNVMNAMTKYPDAVGYDTYVTDDNSFELPTTDWAPHANWLRNHAAYKKWGSPDLYLPEFGIDTIHGDTNCASYFADVPRAMEVNKIRGAVHFNRDRTDNDGQHVEYRIDGGGYPKAKAAFGEAVRQIREALPSSGGGGNTGGGSHPMTFTLGSSTQDLGDPDPSVNPAILGENSGLAVSRKNRSGNNDVLWGHNDSGGANKIYAIDNVAGNGIIAEYTLQGVSNGDWEDIALAPGVHQGGDPDKDYLYVGNVGSSAGTKRIHRFVEPAATPGVAYGSRTIGTISSGSIETFTIQGAPTDCEGFIVMPDTGDVYLFAKQNIGTSRPTPADVYKIDAYQMRAGSRTVTATKVATVDANISGSNNAGVTGADVSEDGRLIAICNYNEVHVWVREEGQKVEDLFKAQKRAPHIRNVGWSGEAIAFRTGSKPDGLYGYGEGPSGGTRLKKLPITWS